MESVTQEKPASADQVQTEGTEQPVNTGAEGEQTPPSQEPETAQNGQIGGQPLFRDGSLLAEILKRSAAEVENVTKVKPADDPEQVLDAIKKDEEERHEAAMTPDPAHAPIRPPEEGVLEFKTPGSPGTRTLTNGDCLVAITIPEEYVTAVKDFAEADGKKTVQQWCTEFFVMMLEAYCAPMKGR